MKSKHKFKLEILFKTLDSKVEPEPGTSGLEKNSPLW